MSEAGAVSDLKVQRNAKYSLSDPPNSYQDITTYNNFYEFGLDKSDPAENSGRFKPTPWTVAVKGEAEKTGTFALEDILKPHTIEERVYRLRCVEAWSMVIPWAGVPLADVLKQFKPTSKAEVRRVQDGAATRRKCRGNALASLDWPYVEGLRIDEAMHPLALLAVGLYGKTLPNQNGAPLRLITPWKYGFKGIKSIVEIRFTEKQPPTTWNISAPHEYGFYANVNPQGRSSALEPGARAQDRRRLVRLARADVDVQRLRTGSRVAVSGHGPEEVLLSAVDALHARHSPRHQARTLRGVRAAPALAGARGVRHRRRIAGRESGGEDPGYVRSVGPAVSGDHAGGDAHQRLVRACRGSYSCGACWACMRSSTC